MASSSSSTRNSQYCPRWKYDVFLSFRGVDTRNNFTSHLHKGLKNRGIFTFLDDERLEDGDSISKELVQAIEESQVAVIVFSKKYAMSRWCLNELVKIMECKEKETGQTVIPVFYYLDPSHVRYQIKSFAESFAKHELRYKNDVEGMQKVQGWRNALTAAADLKGHDIHEGIDQSKEIEQIVDNISSKFCKSARFLSDLQDVVGINSHLKELESLLQIEIDNVRIVGIWGTGGIGKTTIANAIFDTLSNQFEAACFLANVKENAKKNQLHSLQNTLLSVLLRKKDDYISNEYDGKRMIKSRLSSMKVLIVLDDIDERDHLEYLAGDVGWFGNGSRVIVTTRNRKLIEDSEAIYEVHTLPDHEAMQLFNQHAFKKEVPDECFKKFSLEVVNQAKGLPLAIKVWGSMLHKKGVDKWETIVDQIKKKSNSEIVEKLKISYDGLEPEEQKIFLDIACFFRGHAKKEVMKIVDSCDFGAEYGLKVLIDKSLVFISKYDRIEMHDLIEDMGKNIVKMQKDSSRIWNVEDFEDVMMNNMGTREMEAIWFTYSEKPCFSNDAMKNMQSLRILRIYPKDDRTYRTPYFNKPDSNCQDGSIEYLSNNLRWFAWSDYPWKSLPENFNPKRLVHVDLRWSSLHYLWKETKLPQFPSLQRLNLSGSKSLKRTPDFEGMPNLKYLNLEECTSLEEVHPSLKYCEKLIELNLSYCTKLKRFPYVNVESLEYLNLQYCSSLQKFPEILGIRELPLSFFDHQPHHLNDMKNLASLPSSICKSKGLVMLDVSNCSKLESLPEEMGDLVNLEELHASYTLRLVWHKYPAKLLPENFNPGRLVHLELRCSSLLYLWHETKLQQFLSLRRIDLSHSKSLKRTPDFKGMPNLEYLNLQECTSLEEVHPSLKDCKKLIELNLYGCKSLERFPCVNVESLESLNLKYCYSLEKFPEILGRMKQGTAREIMTSDSGIRELPLYFLDHQPHLIEVDLDGMTNLASLPSSICKSIGLVKLRVSSWSKLESLPEEIGDLENLEELDASYTLISRPPSSIVRLNKLKSLCFQKRKSEDRVYFVFPLVNKGLRSLEELDLSYCNIIDEGLLEDIGSLSSLKRLNLCGNNFEYLPRSISKLGALVHLELSDCKRLTQLPEDIGCLSSLEELYLEGNNFEHLPPSISELGALKDLGLSDCKRLTQLPEDIGLLSSLKELYLNGNNFEHLPQSISELGALEYLDLSDCKRLTQLPEFPQQLDTIDADWSNNWICNSLFQNMSSLQHDICSSHSLSLRLFVSLEKDIPSWFNYQGMGTSVSVNLPKNWYVSDNFLGFAVCYSGEYSIDCITAHLIPLCDDGMSLSMTQEFALSNNSQYSDEWNMHFFLVPLGGLWDASNANGKTPNDYGCMKLDVFGVKMKFGVRLLYKDEPDLQIGI